MVCDEKRINLIYYTAGFSSSDAVESSTGFSWMPAFPSIVGVNPASEFPHLIINSLYRFRKTFWILVEC
ncbi:unnamed protein product [Nezara viridula]|uniref:Uncharacterized protein n=1 Tax=Nezara viridula TaxID=85310 RepID=A0A9P0HSM8_NEZVI|nr:unnamed protein product [Nezara viridula]